MPVTNNGYQRADLTRHPMAVTLAGVLLAGFLTFLGWIAVSVSDLKAGQERLSAEIDGIRTGQERLSTEIAELKAVMLSSLPSDE